MILLVTFAWNGMLLGVVSLYAVHRVVGRLAGRAWGWAMVVAVLWLGGLGISLGRFQRYNSWDLFSDPKGLLADVVDRVVNPLTHLHTTAVTLAFSGFLLLAYLAIVAMMRVGHAEGSADGSGQRSN